MLNISIKHSMKGRKAMLESFDSLEKFKGFVGNLLNSELMNAKHNCEECGKCKEEQFNLLGDLTPNDMEELNSIIANTERLKREANVVSSRRELFWNKLYLRFNIPNKGRLKIDDDKLYILDDSREE